MTSYTKHITKTYQHIFSNKISCHIIQTSQYDIAQQDKSQNFIISRKYASSTQKMHQNISKQITLRSNIT